MIVTRMYPRRRVWPNTLDEFDRMRRELSRLTETLTGAEPGMSVRLFPLVNVTQDADSFFVRAELPGVKPEDLTVNAVPSKLTISGKRDLPAEKEGVSYHRREREGGSFSRSISLPSAIAPNRVDASYENGILTIKLPLADEAKPRQIQIKTS